MTFKWIPLNVFLVITHIFCAHSTAADQSFIGSNRTTAPEASIKVTECDKYPLAERRDCINPRCSAGEHYVGGLCVPIGLRCIAPSLLRDGKCVRSGSEVPEAPVSPANSGDAKSCIIISMVQQKGGGEAGQTLTNKCNQAIGLIYCHSPSKRPSTKGTECGNSGRFYQQFTTLQPREKKVNKYSLPDDATITFGACFGGERNIKQTTDGSYNCRL
jgi:hypothetical protein